ncbi:hypothetical protein ACIRU3_28815 [Streptomyces sp. NPDC101151]|uniref:hypothetical protein n=1 Tax=Streptomyces sp. NPDC101151 TaxID=3366115 RepID=UPI00380142F9
MTTATTVAGRPLSGWSRDTRLGTWHALLPDRSGDPVLGALRIDPALLGLSGTRERLAAVVLATAQLRLPGLAGTVDLVAEGGEVWLLTDRPPAPVLADVLSADGPRPDAGGAASILNETAQTLLALHRAGLAHGSLGPDTVVLTTDGVALLAEAALSTVLGDSPHAPRRAGDTDAAAVPPPGAAQQVSGAAHDVSGAGPHADRRSADITAWAALARALGAAWTPAGAPAADLFARCATTAESEGLAAARAALVAGRAALPADFLRRTALRAAAAASTPEFTAPPPSPAHSAAAPSDHPARAREDGHPATTTGVVTPFTTPDPAPDRAALPTAPADSGSPAPRALAPHPPAAADQPTTIGRARSSAVSDTRATVLGKRHRADTPPVPASEESDEVLLRFGPGVPFDEQDVLRARWHIEAAAPAARRPRRRRRGRLVTTAVLAIAAVLLWLLLRPDSAPAVVAVRVQAPAGPLHCGQTADLVGVVTTDGQGGPVTYRWLRGDGQEPDELVRTARRGERRLRVHLRWTVRGPGRFRGTARLRIAHQRAPMEAKASFTYVCP